MSKDKSVKKRDGNVIDKKELWNVFDNDLMIDVVVFIWIKNFI
jgi:hypothetical protein